MKRIFTLTLLLFISIISNAQLLSWSPDFIQESSTPVTITMDANYGNKGLLNYGSTNDVYVHIGVITNKSTGSSDWKHAPFTWGTTAAAAHATYLGSNKWQFTITGGLRSFFSITDNTEKVLKIAILFRNGSGSQAQRNADGSDMYVPVYDNGLYARIDQPYRQPYYVPVPEVITKNVGDNVNITAKSSQTGSLKIYFNGTQVASTSTTSATANPTITAPGNQQIIAVTTNNNGTASDTLNFIVSAPTTVADLPPGIKDGINYESGDTSAVLVLYAPGKQNIYVVGDFNNWTPSLKYQMNETTDSKRFWIRLTGLTPGTEYAYQYFIDGKLKVADYNAQKILDPDNDKYISSATYPNLKAYPTGKTTGIVSVLQTAQPTYNWQVTNFTRPDKRNLVIYELLVRDFTAAGNWQTLKDTLGYLKRLGINAIEVMPFNEFEGNNSWGYNPNFYFAPDKAYGTATALKQFIDACHQQGMAVIMDMVLNHSFGSSPMVQMYYDGVNNIPSADNPWFAQHYTHAYDVGFQFNNASQATADFRDRVIAYWLNNFHIDGYRFDLAKGFTPTNTCDANGNNCNVGTWGNYDQARVNIWDSIYKHQQAVSPGSYCILEMFADNSEEKVEMGTGMMVWDNLNGPMNQCTMGYTDNSDLSYGIYSSRGLTSPLIVDYMESHDEERLMWKNEQYGNSNGTYNVKDTATGLKRNAMGAAFWAMLPGPKMIWQFGELGYDYSINTCSDGVTINNNCRLDNKPIKWNYYQDARRRALYNVYAALLKLRAQPAYASTFTTGTVNYNVGSGVSLKWVSVTGSTLKVVVMGNIGVTQQTATVTFPNTGKWYSYLTDSSTTLSTTTPNITLQPGEYYVFTNLDLHALPVKWLSFTANRQTDNSILLNWSTSEEINNSHFDVERSVDGLNYTLIGSVPAAKANNSMESYTYTDAHPYNGMNYYRLKQVDKDGSFGYSKTIAVSSNGAHVLWQVYPNPAGSNTALYVNTNLSKVQMILTDASGRVVYKSQLSAVTTGQRINLPVQNLAKGVYLLKVSSDKLSHTEKIVVQ
ncbi:MAG TPA: alpha-amylase family glycosyl hydrolase [Chitinophagaceae bacterium]|nr:alpha-amylase family glycosyl hydrolase [Chitinophagaceae bacterium]